MALFSCNVTHAFELSAATVMYSGSKSWAIVLFEYNFLTPLVFKSASIEFQDLKSIVFTCA